LGQKNRHQKLEADFAFQADTRVDVFLQGGFPFQHHQRTVRRSESRAAAAHTSSMIFSAALIGIARVSGNRPAPVVQRAPQFWLKDHGDRRLLRRHDTAKQPAKGYQGQIEWQIDPRPAVSQNAAQQRDGLCAP